MRLCGVNCGCSWGWLRLYFFIEILLLPVLFSIELEFLLLFKGLLGLYSLFPEEQLILIGL